MTLSLASGCRPGFCPHCGRPPDDFVDEDTMVVDSAPTAGLTVIDSGRK